MYSGKDLQTKKLHVRVAVNYAGIDSDGENGICPPKRWEFAHSRDHDVSRHHSFRRHIMLGVATGQLHT